MNDPRPNFHLNLLGGFKLLDGQGQEIRITGKKAQALLAYLALTSGREHSRESLATLLWGDRQDEQARQSLRQALTELRRAFEGNGEVLHTEGDSVSLNGGLAVDALIFGQLLERDSNGSLNEAVGMYAGPLLEESRLDAEGFNTWLGSERERLHGLACGALVRLAGDKEQAGDAEGALEAAKRLLALDPVQEEGHRLLMRLHATVGRRTDALRQYQACAEALRRELDAEPSEATRRLYEEIRNGSGKASNGATPIDAPLGTILQSRGKLIGLAMSVVVVAALVFGGFYANRTSVSPNETSQVAALLGGLKFPEKPSIAVLPFRNLSEDPRQTYFAEGLAEDIITDLSRYDTLFVISQFASFRYEGKNVDLLKVSRELGVRYVLEGSLRKAGSRIRLTAQLIDVTTGQHVWAERYDRPETDFFNLQDEITDNVVVALEVKLLGGKEAKDQRRETTSLEAYYNLRRANELWNQYTREANAEGIETALKAIELDPQFGSAYGKLGFLYHQVMIHQLEKDLKPWFKKSQDVALQIKKLERQGFYTRHYLAINNVFFLGKIDEGFEIAEQNLKEFPNISDVVGIMGLFLFSKEDRLDEAIGLLRRSIRLEPFPEAWKVNMLGYAYHFAGRLEEAIAAYKMAISISPNISAAHMYLAAAYYQSGQQALARAQAKDLRERHPNFRLTKRLKFEKSFTAPYKEPQAEIFKAAEKAGIPWD